MRTLTLILLALLTTSIATASQTDENSILVSPPHAQATSHDAQPGEPSNISTAVGSTTPVASPEEVLPPAVAYRQPRLIPVDPIRYKDHPSARRLLSRGQHEVVVAVDNPQDGNNCLYKVPICLPACCQSVPRVCPRRGLLGRGVVVHTWPCGFEVEVVFRLRGDVLVRSAAH